MLSEKTYQIDEVIDKYVGKEGALIQLLLEIQHLLNWIPREAVQKISEKLKIPVSEIYRVASFYTAMSLVPRGKHLVRVCTGTACYVRGAQRILDAAEQTLKIKVGETSEDLKFTLEKVNCLGCCALGPVAEINGKYHGLLTRKKLEDVLNRKKDK